MTKRSREAASLNPPRQPLLRHQVKILGSPVIVKPHWFAQEPSTCTDGLGTIKVPVRDYDSLMKDWQKQIISSMGVPKIAFDGERTFDTKKTFPPRKVELTLLVAPNTTTFERHMDAACNSYSSKRLSSARLSTNSWCFTTADGTENIYEALTNRTRLLGKYYDRFLLDKDWAKNPYLQDVSALKQLSRLVHRPGSEDWEQYEMIEQRIRELEGGGHKA